MPTYTMRAAWPDNPDRTADYVFRVDGRDAGRCYFTRGSGQRDYWLWTVYGGGAGVGGLADTLDEAQAKFKMAIERTCGSANGRSNRDMQR